MSGWLIWVVVGAVLAVGELLTPGLFFLGPVALAAAAAAIVAAAGLATWVQLVVFVAGSAASVGILRPVARAHLHAPAPTRTGTAALVGATGVVTQRIDSGGGRVKIGGEEWSARAYVDGEVFEPGVRVEIAKIEGATALVYE